ncbi:hypothetical protein BC936DRAFT_137356 [Jimgerdemannia flammicorona]|uniref:Selenoprotein O n=1 Tax=Jimgerdemannia flammicorona TaxID=994334 RepID=A0A433CXJ2_9FUNG|nr:hypothetical protein BC936DRAFT_137356 [Jimgerdemannia flammicorona]
MGRTLFAKHNFLATTPCLFSTMASILKPKFLSQLPATPCLLTSSLPNDPLTPDPDNLPARAFLAQARPVYNACYTYVPPEAAPEPKLLAVSRAALELINLDPKEAETENFVGVFSGNKVLEGTHPWALCYGGHQFGAWAGQLGDGRAISLFETVNYTRELWELQLKGAGRTPYSRFADGYAVLRSSIREFLCSEALAALSIPTTRALSLVTTSRDVYRDDAPDTVRQPERGAIVCRLAPSWLRFGSFEILYQRKDAAGIRSLAEFVAREVVNVNAEIAEREEREGWNRFGRLYREIGRRTARMVAGWQSVGFCHGVMNTDNMSILGLTLDLGPFAFLEAYDPAYICNHSDDLGRYSFLHQPTACMWNLHRLGVTLAELIGAGDEVDVGVDPVSGVASWDDDTSKRYREKGDAMARRVAADEFEQWFLDDFTARMRAKLGLSSVREGDLDEVVVPLLNWMSDHRVDYHHFFRALANLPIIAGEALPDELVPGVACDIDAAKSALGSWVEVYRRRVLEDGGDKGRKVRMNGVNPAFVLKNWVAQEVLDAFEKEDEEKGREALEEALELCLEPFGEGWRTERAKRWATGKTPQWGQCLRCSCSS